MTREFFGHIYLNENNFHGEVCGERDAVKDSHDSHLKTIKNDSTLEGILIERGKVIKFHLKPCCQEKERTIFMIRRQGENRYLFGTYASQNFASVSNYVTLEIKPYQEFPKLFF